MRNMVRKSLISNKTLHEKCHNDNIKHRPYNRYERVDEIDMIYSGEYDLRDNVDTSDYDENGPKTYRIF